MWNCGELQRIAECSAKEFQNKATSYLILILWEKFYGKPESKGTLQLNQLSMAEL